MGFAKSAGTGFLVGIAGIVVHLFRTISSHSPVSGFRASRSAGRVFVSPRFTAVLKSALMDQDKYVLSAVSRPSECRNTKKYVVYWI